MNLTFETIEHAAKQLSPKERSALVRSLLEDLDENGEVEVETEIEKAWLDEVERRIEAYRLGLIGSLPFEETIARVRAGIAK
ncbi:MAG: addiction module protein [Acidobacteria bacterium]|nr:addiction module protein [Acidobacteriota bacterium]